jgi:hypothetical protein
MRRTLLLPSTMAIGLLLASGVALAAAATFSNTSPILITDVDNGQADPANPYPSEILVDNAFPGQTVRDVNLILKGFRHAYPDDAGVLLVGPQGQSALVMSDVGGGHAMASGVKLVLDDEATASLPDDGPLASGTYKPTRGTIVFSDNPVPDPFPQPAPTGPYGTDLSVFDGTDPNGIWKLYVLDDTDVDTGKIRGGWALRINAV